MNILHEHIFRITDFHIFAKTFSTYIAYIEAIRNIEFHENALEKHLKKKLCEKYKETSDYVMR